MDPEVGKVAAKLQSGFFSKFSKREERKPNNSEPPGVLSSITSFMSSSSKNESSHASPKDSSETETIEGSDKKTEALESNDSDGNLKNLDTVVATKHGTNATNV